MKRHIREGTVQLTETDHQAMIDLYDAEIAHTDLQIGRILNQLEAVAPTSVLTLSQFPSLSSW